eukprot:1132582-Rhodomonas_salina.2
MSTTEAGMTSVNVRGSLTGERPEGMGRVKRALVLVMVSAANNEDLGSRCSCCSLAAVERTTYFPEVSCQAFHLVRAHGSTAVLVDPDDATEQRSLFMPADRIFASGFRPDLHVFVNCTTFFQNMLFARSGTFFANGLQSLLLRLFERTSPERQFT